jgi:hypothetical protein
MDTDAQAIRSAHGRVVEQLAASESGLEPHGPALESRLAEVILNC